MLTAGSPFSLTAGSGWRRIEYIAGSRSLLRKKERFRIRFSSHKRYERMATTSDSVTSLTLLRRLRDSPDDQQSWEEFVDRYGGMIQGWCLSWGLQEADALDVTQNVLLKIAKHMRRFEYRAGGRFRSWLRTVARNAWFDYLDSQRRVDGASGDDSVLQLLNSVEAREDFLTRLEREYDHSLLDDAMRQVQQRVEPHTWRAFIATAVEGHPGAAVAAELGVQLGTVYVARSKVKKMLQTEIQRLEEDD